MASFSSSSLPVRRLMRSTSVLFLHGPWEAGKCECGGQQAAHGGWRAAAAAVAPLRPPRRGQAVPVACLVDMEVTRRWSPVSRLRHKHTEVCRAAAGEKAEHEKRVRSPMAAPAPC